jgi:sialic acid synthase SpsE
METARSLIQVARDAGCDIIKFQTLDPESISSDDPEREWFERIALDPTRIATLIKYANEEQISILFTPENIKTTQWLLDVGLKDIKISSSSASDIDLIGFIANNFQRVFISTGMASLDEVNQAVAHLSKVPELYIMHCISEYPTGPLLEQRGLVAMRNEDARLNMMKILMSLFPMHKIGYSDHTSGILASIVAVAMGAKVIEKHITMDRATPVNNYLTNKEYLGTDHVLSLEPDELRVMVEQIREVEKIVGDWKWERTQGEKLLLNFIRGRF